MYMYVYVCVCIYICYINIFKKWAGLEDRLQNADRSSFVFASVW